ncbi:MAG: NifU family protein [Acidobacteria bacterium]|jgi:Fe-S cluster biogenesis protein NfuA|nr:MAG: NifU family protein [Acidobacteriota bacterium]GIU83052.1 MAG: iron transporter [Pyrinomonadaceae bacterium]
MPKIADIQETPNPNAVKFILKEPVSHGTSHFFRSKEEAEKDELAKAIFEVGNVVSVFYMDRMITVEKTDESDWEEVLPALAVPIRAAKGVSVSNKTNGNKTEVNESLFDDPKVREIEAILDERIRPYLVGDGGWLEIVGFENNVLKIRYEGACGSCPSSLTGTLMAIENILKQEVDPEIEVIAV